MDELVIDVRMQSTNSFRPRSGALESVDRAPEHVGAFAGRISSSKKGNNVVQLPHIDCKVVYPQEMAIHRSNVVCYLHCSPLYSPSAPHPVDIWSPMFALKDFYENPPVEIACCAYVFTCGANHCYTPS